MYKISDNYNTLAKKGTGYFFKYGIIAQNIQGVTVPRIARGLIGGEIYHIINRGNRKMEVFHFDRDYEKFIALLFKGKEIAKVELYAFAIMPNHFHLILKPEGSEDISKYMQWISTSYVRFYNKIYKTSGHLWQGRYKNFIVKKDNYFANLYSYVLQNPSRAKLKNWKHTSKNYINSGFINKPPLDIPHGLQKISKTEMENIKQCIKRQSPYGDNSWQQKICKQYNLNSTIRPRGRPRKDV